ERAVLRHQRNIAVENFLFLDVANRLRAGVGILVVNRETNSDLERGGIRHAALLAFVHVVLQLHGDRVAALVAEGRGVLVERAALVADDVASLIRIGDDASAAIPAGRAEVVQPLQVAALALPVADGIVHEFELRHFAEIPDRKHAGEHRLKTAVLALARQQIHLQEALIGLHLDFNQVGNLNRALDFREIQPLTFPDVLIAVRHAWFTSLNSGETKTRGEDTNSRSAKRVARTRRAHGYRRSRRDAGNCRDAQPRRA